MKDTERKYTGAWSAENLCITSRQTCAHILDAAEELFAEKGYTRTSVRDITSKARCNLASVNYHFGNKHNLYVQVFLRRLSELRELRVTTIQRLLTEGDEVPQLRQFLEAFASAFLDPLVRENRGRQFMRLMAWEMLSSQLPARIFLDEMIEPVEKAFVEAIKTICPDLGTTVATFCGYSFIGQLLHLIHARRIFDEKEAKGMKTFEMADYISHIIRFTMAGVNDYIREGPSEERSDHFSVD